MPTYNRTCKIKILNEVECVFIGMHPDHIGYFYEDYAAHAPNYFFNPKFKLGQWDGKIRYFHKTGKTYVKLLDEIIPKVIALGYKIQIEDQRDTLVVHPEPVTEDFFSNIIDPSTNEAWKMRPYQVELVNALMANGGGVGIAGTGGGKAQPLTSKVLTPTGWIRMGDILPGMEILTPSGKPSKVVDVFPQGIQDIYEVVFHDGAKTHCELNHLWDVYFPRRLHKAWTERRVVTTKEIIDFLERKRSGVHTPGNVSVPLVAPIDQPQQQLPIDPYLLGVLIGDGSLRGSPSITTKDSFVLSEVTRLVTSLGLIIKHRENYDYAIINEHSRNTVPPSCNVLTNKLTDLGLFNKKSYEKFVPEIYFKGSLEQRMQLIRGLMDTDGTSDSRGMISFTSTSEQLAKDVQRLVWSVGGTCTITSRIPAYTYNGEKKDGRLAYTCFIRHPTPKEFFMLERKRQRCKDLHADGRIQLTRRIVSIKRVDRALTQCIMIDDPNHLYITDDYIVTHNTSMTAALALSYEKAAGFRSIIVVPDKNLTKQTLSEYEFFGLDAGEYSGTKKDLDHQHIVSTWQSLQNNPEIIQNFHMVVVDECHGLRGNVLTKLLNEYGSKISYRFGVTGTLPKDETDAMSVKIAVGTVQYTIPAHQLIEEGYLSNLQIDIIQHDIDLTSQYKDFLTEKPFPKPTYKQFKDSYFPDWPSEKRFLQTEENRLQWIADYITLCGEQKKGNVLCLVNGVQMGKKLSKLIPGSHFIHGDDEMKVRQEIYALFKDNDNVIVIATVNIASTGLNIPRIFNLIYIDIGRSFIRTIQSIGRALRKAHDKDFARISDICSDLKYSKRHLRERVKYYNEAKYPNKKKVVQLTESNLDVNI